MIHRLPIGSYRTVSGPHGEIPWYIVPFDRAGACTGPRTAEAAVEQAASGAFTDVVIFSHGWNNDWEQATSRYQSFVTGYLELLGQHPPTGEVRSAMLIGLYWPSKLLVDPADAAPEIAGAPGPAGADDKRPEFSELSGFLDGKTADRFYELTRQEAITQAEATELAEMFILLLAADQAESGQEGVPEPAEIAAAWAHDPGTRLTRPADLDALGFATPPPSGQGPEAAGLFESLNPRAIVRTLSVWQMKDRAGTVGSRGVATLLRDVVQAGPRVHLVGHSFGAKVLLTALCAPPELPSVRSVLLLQPAVSHLCFADSVPGSGRTGGFQGALSRVDLPILSTFSDRDRLLTRLYQLAMWRRRDLGEPEIAAAGAPGEPPSRYAALGGFGPRPLGGRIDSLKVLNPGTSYRLDGDATDVYGVDASRTISDHGDVSNPSTWWLLSQLVHQR